MATSSPSITHALSVADLLRQRIFNGEIPPGSHLMEVPLANELGVSRTPVRDALARLALEGLLAYQPNRGFVVRSFQVKDVRDAFTLRASLESLGCRLVGERGFDPASRERFDGFLEDQRRVLYEGEWTPERALQWHGMNLKFHYSLNELADNRWLMDAVWRSRQLPPVFDSLSRPHSGLALGLLYRREHSRQAYAEHRRIIDALKRGEVARAESLMREHILTNRDVLLDALFAADGPGEGGSESAP